MWKPCFLTTERKGLTTMERTARSESETGEEEFLPNPFNNTTNRQNHCSKLAQNWASKRPHHFPTKTSPSPSPSPGLSHLSNRSSRLQSYPQLPHAKPQVSISDDSIQRTDIGHLLLGSDPETEVGQQLRWLLSIQFLAHRSSDIPLASEPSESESTSPTC